MTVINISKNAKAPIQTAQHVRNGKYPGAELQNLIADRAGHSAYVRTKLVYRSPGFIIGTADAALIPASTSGTRYRWRFPYHAGPYAKHLFVDFQLAAQDNGSATSPYGKLEISTSPTYATVLYAASMSWGSAPSAYSDVPLNFGGGTTTLQDPATPSDLTAVSVTPLTQYFGRFADIDYARIQSVAVWEVSLPPDTDNGYAPNTVGAGSPIFDEDRADPAEMGRKLWAYGAQTLWHWSVDTDAGVRSQTNGDLSGTLTQSIGEFTLTATGTVGTSAPTYQAVTSFQTSTSSTMSIAWPAHAANDVAFLVILTDTGDGLSPQVSGSDWTFVDDSDLVTVYRARASSGSMSDPTITFRSAFLPDRPCGAAIITVRGAVTSGNPIDTYVTQTTSSSTSSTTSTTTTTVANTLLLSVHGSSGASTVDSWSTSGGGTGLTGRLAAIGTGTPGDGYLTIGLSVHAGCCRHDRNRHGHVERCRRNRDIPHRNQALSHGLQKPHRRHEHNGQCVNTRRLSGPSLSVHAVSIIPRRARAHVGLCRVDRSQ